MPASSDIPCPTCNKVNKLPNADAKILLEIQADQIITYCHACKSPLPVTVSPQ